MIHLSLLWHFFLQLAFVIIYLCSFHCNFHTMSTMSGPVTGTLQIKWDPKNLEIRTKSVEKTLEPLVTQVSCSVIKLIGFYRNIYVYVFTVTSALSLFQCFHCSYIIYYNCSHLYSIKSVSNHF